MYVLVCFPALKIACTFSHLRHTWSGDRSGELTPHPLNQSDAKLKPIVSWSRVYYSRSYWLLVMLTLVPIGHCDFSGFGFKTPNTNSFVVTK